MRSIKVNGNCLTCDPPATHHFRTGLPTDGALTKRGRLWCRIWAPPLPKAAPCLNATLTRAVTTPSSTNGTIGPANGADVTSQPADSLCAWKPIKATSLMSPSGESYPESTTEVTLSGSRCASSEMVLSDDEG